jgi:hypothetical protein
MKTLLLTLGLMAALVRAGYAAEYRTLTDNSPDIDILPSSLVEVTAVLPASYTVVRFTFADGKVAESSLSASYVGSQLTGLTKAEILRYNSYDNIGTVSLKITPANEINVVAPTSLLVIPENSTGNYNIVVETSSDTATWTPFHSQTVSANDAKRFFRTRIVKAE